MSHGQVAKIPSVWMRLILNFTTEARVQIGLGLLKPNQEPPEVLLLGLTSVAFTGRRSPFYFTLPNWYWRNLIQQDTGFSTERTFRAMCSIQWNNL